MKLSDRIRPDVEAAPWVIEEVKKLEAEVAHLRDTLEDFAEYDCEYEDNCPSNAGTRHGTCVGCKARQALEKK